jgi:hypothetical protein
MISDGRNYYVKFFNSTSTTDISGVSAAFSTQGGIIVGMFFFSLALAIAFIFLVKAFPKCVVYTMVAIIYIIFIALIVLGIINGIWWMVATFGVTILMISCIIYCFRSKISTGILLLQIGTTFISERPSVFLAPLYSLIFGIMFFVFWVIALIS